MKGRTFETFEVAAGNREAFDYCRRVAGLEELGPALALLLGPERCGKSHLLWSIAKQVRLSAVPVGLALITPQDFPDKVKDLVEDPRPLQGRRAILLVDNLEGFEGEARRLEAVIETFLNHQHPVVIASNVQPNRLRQLSGPLRARFARSYSIIMEPRLTEGEDPVAVYERMAALERRIEELEVERDGLNEKLTVAFASAEDLAKETVAMEERVRELRSEADHAMAQQVRAQIALSEARFEQEESADLREQLAERERALAGAEACVASALMRLEEMRAAHAAQREDLLSNINAMAGELAAPENEAPLLQALAEAGREHEHVRAALTATRERLKLVEFEWEKTKKVLAIQTAEMDALRYSAATQVASANIHAGEIEHRLESLEAALSQVEAAAIEASHELPSDTSALRNLQAAAEQVQRQMAALRSARTEARAQAEPDSPELSIFETDFFEALPEDFVAPGGNGDPRTLPGAGETLRRAADGARSKSPAPAEDSPGQEAPEAAADGGGDGPAEGAAGAPAADSDGEGAEPEAPTPPAGQGDAGEAAAGEHPDDALLRAAFRNAAARDERENHHEE